MQHLGLIVPYITEGVPSVSTPFIVCFVIMLSFKWKLFERWADLFKLKDICYFCFCFWLSLIFGDSLIDVLVSTVISKTILTINGL